MARPKRPTDDAAAVELERMADQFGERARYHFDVADSEEQMPRPPWMTVEVAVANVHRDRGNGHAYARAARALRMRAARLRNGTAGW